MPRLPIPGSDDGEWGSILNEYLAYAHDSSGGLKPDVVSGSQIQDGVIGLAKLNSSVANSLNLANSSLQPGSNVSNLTNDANYVDSSALSSSLTSKADDSSVVHNTGNEAVAGIKAFSSFPLTPSSTPTSDYQVANKKYVDDSVTSAGGYNDEAAQDAVGSILTNTSELNLSYDDLAPSISATINSGSISASKLDASTNASLTKADSAIQPGDSISSLTNDAGYLTTQSVTSVAGKTGDVTLTADDIDDTSTTNKFVTASDLTKLSNTSGTNTGDQDLSGLVTKTTTISGHPLSSNITLTKSDVGLANVDNTSDLTKPISTATQTVLDLKANSADLATVATTGSYNDLADKPTIPTVSVDSVNSKTGAVVLDADDIDDTSTTNKFVTSSDLTKLSNTSGINTGDQDLSGLVTKTTTINSHDLSSNVTLTKSDIGLANVDNTSDLNKPVSIATQSALDLKANTADLGSAASSETSDFATAAQGVTADSALQPGDNISALNNDSGYISSAPVSSVNSQTGDVVLTKTDVGLSNVDNTSDLNKPVSTATQTVLDLKANSADLATVATTGSYGDLTGKPTLGTASAADTSAFATAAQGTLADSAVQPGDNISDLTNNSGYIAGSGTAIITVGTSAPGSPSVGDIWIDTN